MEKIMIAAVADDGAIGRDNALLWHIAEDMKYFRRTTMGCPVIMGYRTWLSIGRPLPGRLNIVITKQHFDAPDSVVQVPDIPSAFEEARKGCVDSSNGGANDVQRCFVMGGAKTYERAMEHADVLYITHVHTSVPDADAFFPPIDGSVWQKSSETPVATDPENGLRYSFAVYRRK
ncbi:MAG: dihydrofolate reductase [Candidatus Cryptobacteroides sp.]